MEHTLKRSTLRLALAPSAGRAILAFAILVAALAPAGAATVPDGFVDALVAPSLASPAGLAFLPDGRLLVTEQFTARVKIVSPGAGAATTIFTVPDVISGGERGLLGVAVDPGWPARPYLYFNFSHAGSAIYVRMYTVAGDLTDPTSTNLTLADPYNILVDIPDFAFNHNGGTLRFGLDGKLLVSTGDDASACDAQDLTSLSGKILRLDVDALPGAGSGPPPKSDITPADNPFPGPDENERLVWCHGLRNPFRFSVDPVTGKLYIGDVGSFQWEEVNEAQGSENFGWPKREGAHPGPGGCGTDGIDPIWEYPNTAGASVMCGPRYRLGPPASFPAEYDGSLFVHDYYAGDLKRLVEQGGSWSVAPAVPGQPEPTSWATGLSFVPEMIQGPDGALYYPSQSAGQVRRIAADLVLGAGEPEPLDALDPLRLIARPNPIRTAGGTSLRFVARRAGTAELAVYDVLGAKVLGLASEVAGPGQQVLAWDGRTGRGERLEAGVYFLRILAPGVPAQVTKLVVSR